MADHHTLFGIEVPVIQAPMAGVSTPELAAAVCEAGGLGSLGLATSTPEAAQESIRALRSLTSRPFNVNVFCHQPAKRDPVRETEWLARLAPEFERNGAEPPSELREIYRTFLQNPEMLEMLLAERPPVVSFHFGVPEAAVIARFKAAGARCLASATSPEEARKAVEAGCDAVVAQGYEAGGHRGIFDPEGFDARLGTMALTRILVRTLSVPVITAGGLMDGGGLAAALALGAVAGQFGTAFVTCPESAADAAYREAFATEAAHRTTMTLAISGRPARALQNRFTRLGETAPVSAVPAYPVAYDAGKALNAAAKAAGEPGFGAMWAGQGAPLARAMPAGELVATLMREFEAARR